MDDNLTLAENAVGMSEKIMRELDDRFNSTDPNGPFHSEEISKARSSEASTWLKIANARLAIATERGETQAGN